MTTEEMIIYTKRKIEICEDLIGFSQLHEVDEVILRVNQEMLDYYKSVLPLLEQAK